MCTGPFIADAGTSTLLARSIDERRIAVMGTTAHIIVVGASPALADRAAEELRSLEARWSRFLPDSEISRLNQSAGTALAVSADTRRLVATAIEAWMRTDGRFDPTVLSAMRANGYDRTYEQLQSEAGRDPSVTSARAGAAPGCAGIVVHNGHGTVRLDPGVGFDPGGIGKGLAADIVVERILAGGAKGVLVNVGGDLRVEGAAPEGELWVVSVREPTVSDGEIVRIGLIRGALATSTTRRRRWSSGGSERHHLLDPRTGDPLRETFQLVGAVAEEGWWAEAATKSVMVGAAANLAGGTEIAWFGVDESGVRHISPAMQDFVLR